MIFFDLDLIDYYFILLYLIYCLSQVLFKIYSSGYISSVAMIFLHHKVHCRIIETIIYYYPPPQGCHAELWIWFDLIWIWFDLDLALHGFGFDLIWMDSIWVWFELDLNEISIKSTTLYPTRNTILAYDFVYNDAKQQLLHGLRADYLTPRDRATKRNHTRVEGRHVSRDWLEKNIFAKKPSCSR